MRNLKKILALVLAMMMVLSMMVTANAAFADADDITDKYAEAVEVLSGVGVIRGVENTDGTFNFNPKGNLNRAEAATIIAYVLEGNLENIDTLVDAVSNPFNDLPSWAEPYVLYAYNAGIVVGDGNGSYSPKRELTGYEFGKMLLIAAGICDNDDFAKDWKVVVASELKKAELWDSKDFALSAKLTREQACYLAFNAMLYTADGSTYYEVSNGTNTYKFDSMQDALLYKTMLSTATDVYTVTSKTTNEGSLADKVFALGTLTGTDPIGLNGYYWYCDANRTGSYETNTKDTIVSAFICTDTVYGVFGVGDTFQKNVSAALNKTDYTVSTYVNGDVSDNVYVAATDTTAVAVSTDSSKYMVLVKTATGTFNGLYVNEVLTNAVRGAKITDKTSKYYGLYNWSFVDLSNTTVANTIADANAYSNTAKYLVVANTGKEIIDLAEAETVVGTITATATTYIRIGGNKISKANTSVAATASNTTPVVCYLNSAGDLIYVGSYSAAAASYDGVAYLSAFEYVGNNKSTTGLYGTVDAQVSAKAIITTAEGETLSVDAGTMINKKGEVSFYLNEWVSASTSGVVTAATVGYWAAYTVEDGAYYFDKLSSTNKIEDADYGTATVKINDDIYYLNADTVISFINYNTDTKANEVLAFAGYASTSAYYYLDDVNGNDLCISYVADNNGVLSSVTVYGKTTTVETTTYAVYAGLGETAYYGQYHNFYVGGELKSYMLENKVTAPDAKAVVTFKTDADGVITEITPVESTEITANITVLAIAADGSYFIGSDNNLYYLGTGYVVYDGTNYYAASELAVGEIVTVVKGADTKVACVIITDFAD